jgi:hypothetical protein
MFVLYKFIFLVLIIIEHNLNGYKKYILYNNLQIENNQFCIFMYILTWAFKKSVESLVWCCTGICFDEIHFLLLWFK